MAPRWFQDGSKMVSLFAGGVGATGPGAILGPSWISLIFSKKVAKIVSFYSIFETDPAFYLDENAARALKCVRGRKNERWATPLYLYPSSKPPGPLKCEHCLGN